MLVELHVETYKTVYVAKANSQPQGNATNK
jgi:hypothetical protein